MKIFSTLAILFLVVSCSDKTENPYTIFDNSNVQITTDELFKINLENYFDGSAPTYTMRRNNERAPNITDSSFVSRTAVGYSGPQDLQFEKVIIELDFDSTYFSSGDILIISSMNGSIQRSKIFEVF